MVVSVLAPIPVVCAILVRSLESAELTIRLGLSITCAVIAVLGGVLLYRHGDAAPACDSDKVQGEVSQALHDRFHLGGVFLHDFTTTSGDFFSTTRDCSAEVAEIRGNVDAADLSWRRIRYHITRPDPSDAAVVSVDLGGAAPFAPPQVQTLWARFLAHL